MNEREVSNYVAANEAKALERTNELLDKDYLKFSGFLGGKNTMYGVNPLNYQTPESYIQAWMNSHYKRHEDEKNSTYKSSHRINTLLQDNFMEEFIKNYLARLYFRKHKKQNK